MTRRGIVDETALGLAEAVGGDPAFAALVLIASTVLFRDVRWDVGAMFLAGAAVSRRPRKTRWGVFLAMAVASRFDGVFAERWWADLDRLTTPELYTAKWYLQIGLMLLAGGAGMRSVWFMIIGASTALVVPVVRHEFVPLSAPLTWSGVTIVLVALGAARFPRTGFLVGVACYAATQAWQIATGYTMPVGRELAAYVVTVATELGFVCWPVIAALAARHASDLDERHDATRLIVLAQRHPWPATSLVAAFVLFRTGTSFPLLEVPWSRDWCLPSLMALCLGSTLIASLATNAGTPLGWLVAPFWLTTATFATWATSRGGSWKGADEQLVVAHTALAALGPLLLVQLVRRRAPVARWLPAAVVALVVIPAFVADHEWDGEPSLQSAMWIWLAVGPIVFQSATHVEASSRRVVVVAATLGVADWLAMIVGGSHEARKKALAIVGVWFLGGVYVVIARRARSLTAVPLDHPIVRDFGVRPE